MRLITVDDRASHLDSTTLLLEEVAATGEWNCLNSKIASSRNNWLRSWMEDTQTNFASFSGKTRAIKVTAWKMSYICVNITGRIHIMKGYSTCGNPSEMSRSEYDLEPTGAQMHCNRGHFVANMCFMRNWPQGLKGGHCPQRTKWGRDVRAGWAGWGLQCCLSSACDGVCGGVHPVLGAHLPAS